MFRRTLLAAAVAVAAGSGAAEAQIRIATAGPMTGQYAAFGAQMRAGAVLAVADINAAGGVLGQPVVLEIADDACDPRHTVTVAKNLVSRGVLFVAGHFCSGSSIPASKVYAEAGVLQTSPASTNPRFTDEGGWNTFRVCGRDDRQGLIAANHILANLPGRRVAILHDNSAYGKGVANEVRRVLNAGGMEQALNEAYGAGERDYSALVSRLQQATVEVVYFAGYHIETALIVRQMRERGLKALAIGTDALATDEFWQITGPAGEGTLMTIASDPRRRPAAAEVVAKFRARNIEPEGYVLYTYAAIQLWAEAARRAGTTDPRRVAEALKARGPWQSVLGPIAFDQKGDITQPDYVLFVWRNGTYAEL
jgi:branched-chain amino acid transport system substrate-binding protein